MKLTSSQLVALQEAVSMVELEGQENPLGKGHALQKAPASPEDNVSLDSNDLPKMFATPPQEKGKEEPKSASKRGGQHSKSFLSRRKGSLVEDKDTKSLRQAMGFTAAKPCKRPASLEASLEKGQGAVPLAKGKNPKALAKGKGPKALAKGKSPKAFAKGKSFKALAKGKGPKALAKGKSSRSLAKGKSDGPWYTVRKTNAQKPKRTYLTGCLEAGPGKQRKLIVEVPAKWSTRHDYICDEIMKSLNDGIGKEEALHMRSVLVQHHP